MKRGFNLGAWPFIAGIVLAVIAGLTGNYLGKVNLGIQALLVLIGIIIGIFNIDEKDTLIFLGTSSALIFVGFAGTNALGIISQIGAILNAVLLMLIPAVVIVALKQVFLITRG
jgi:hypothetical protein